MLCVSFCQQSLACDVCGSAGIGIGLLTDYKSNFLRWSYNQSKFQSVAHHENQSTDNFHQMKLSMRYTVLDKVHLMVQLPYSINTRTDNASGSTVKNTGIADANIRSNYTVVNRNITAKTSLYIESGLGLILPCGKYDARIYDRNLPENFNIGRGAFGYTTQTNAVLTKANYGLINNYIVQLNGNSTNGYHFGNQFSAQLTAFKEIAIKQLKWIPNVGINYEFVSTDRYKNKKVVASTGGQGLLSTIATNFKTENWLAGFTYSIPLSGNYSDGMANAKSRISCQFSYLF